MHHGYCSNRSVGARRLFQRLWHVYRHADVDVDGDSDSDRYTHSHRNTDIHFDI
jgi:hypothetical protein